MDPRAVFYKHPYATMVTAAFLFSIITTALYYFRLFPGVSKTQPKLDGLLIITAVLLVATAATWFTAIILRSDAI